MLRIKTRAREQFVLRLSAFVLVALSLMATPFFQTQKADAAGETLTGASGYSGQAGAPISINNLQVVGSGNPTVPINIHATSGFLSLRSTTGLTFTGGHSGKTIEFSGSLSAVNAALATLKYQKATVGSDTIEVSIIGAGEIYNPTNGHLYEFVSNTLDWNDANAEAQTRTKNGAQGYLATITSADENEFVASRLNGAGWMGASDAATEGDWKWVGGPEAGTSFWSGLDANSGGSPVSGRYSSWGDGEPNNAGDEDCTQYLSGSGFWNDLPCAGTTLEAYAVEYGAPGDLPNVAYKNITVNTQAVSYPGGTGTTQSPYQITDCRRLQGMDQNLSAHYVLTADVDCSETDWWNGGAGFNPIGNDGSPFTGTFNAQGHTIDALHIIRADDDQWTDFYSDPDTNEQFVGLFGNTDNATISNLHITNSKIKGYQYVGGIIGYMNGGTLTNSTFNIGVAQNNCDPGLCVWARYGQAGGGLVGHLESGTVSNSQTAGPVKGSGVVIGGLIGEMMGGTLTNSSSSSSVDGGTFIGGAIGSMNGGTATRVHVSGNVVTNTLESFKDGKFGGGFVGALEGGQISESYATGDVDVEVQGGGGFAGVLFSNSSNSITDSYATGDVYSQNGYDMGGFVGKAYEGTIERTYASGTVTADSTAGSFVGTLYTAAIHDSFAAGQVSTINTPVGGFLADAPYGAAFAHNYFDMTGTAQSDCGAGVTTDCMGVNAASAQPKYLIDYANAPFTQSSSRVWSDSIWYFDGLHHPVLRMGTTNPASVRPLSDDGDGISAAIENAGPNNGDGNNDGTPDAQQPNVTSFVSSVTGKYVTLEVDGACSITQATTLAEPSGGVADGAYNYPFGLLSYTADCGTPGYSTDVSVYYHGANSATGMVARKYNSNTHSYGVVAGAAVSGTSPVKVTYTATDGLALDEDGAANGIIVDPVGLAVVQPAGFLSYTGVSQLWPLVVGVSGIVFAAIFASVRARYRVR